MVITVLHKVEIWTCWWWSIVQVRVVLGKIVGDWRFDGEGPLLETLEFFEISYGSYQPFNFLPYLALST